MMERRKERARMLILHYVMQFSLSTRFGDRVCGGLSDCAFVPDSAEAPAIPGDLVALQSAPPSPFYLGWLVERSRPSQNTCETFRIESIETGALCDWSNVGIMYLWRQTVQEHPSWRWTDRQHAFNDLWMMACYKGRDAYLHLPVQAEFGEGHSVTLRVRVRHALAPEVPARQFADWRKVTRGAMLAFYDDAVREIEQARKERGA